jgi:hypothetical protein
MATKTTQTMVSARWKSWSSFNNIQSVRREKIPASAHAAASC